MKSIARTCEVCSAIYQSRSRSPEREKFCSAACRRRYWNQIMWRKYRHKRVKWTQIERLCATCSTVFMAKASNHVCCSRICNEKRQDTRKKAAALQNWNKTPRVCGICSQEFVPGRYGWHRQKYCSRSCSATARMRQSPPRKSRNLRASLRAALIQRANGRCEICGVVPPRFEAHHLDWNWKHNELSNLIGLCGPCHRAMDVTCRVEDGKLILTSAQWRWFPPESILFR